MRINLISPQNKNDGYSSLRDDLLLALRKKDIIVDFNLKGANIDLVLGHPRLIEEAESDKVVLFTMFESTKLPSGFGIARSADLIITPSNWCADVFQKELNLEIRPTVIPLGVNTDDFYFMPRKQKNKKFIVLNYNAFDFRKGFWELLKAWQMEMADKEDAMLILKTTSKVSPFPLHNYPNIVTLVKDYDRNQLRELLGIADCFVFPSMGEGFGLTPLEAAATGLNPIFTNGSGMTEYADQVGYPIPYDGLIPATYGIPQYDAQDLGYFTKPNVKQLNEHILNEYKKWKEYESGSTVFYSDFQLADFIKHNYSIDNTAEKLIKVFNEIN